MTSRYILFQLERFVKKHPKEICLKNFYYGRFEMDLMVIKRSLYINEYEVKTSRSDFRNDFNKSYGTGSFTNQKTINKHDELSEGKGVSNRFFFVVPDGLITVNECPQHAGLIYVKNQDIRACQLIKPAPLLHKIKFNDWQLIAYSLHFRLLDCQKKMY